MRAPIWLYRARLGFLLGSRVLMLEHVGRRSGKHRYVVLEVFGHPAVDTYLVVSGFGPRAQWYRNVRANPHVRVFVAGRRPAPAIASQLEGAAADAALAEYVAAHPGGWSRFKPVIERTLGARIDDTDTALPILELRLR